jgi:uncharacterized membrane protein YkvA (DUF1232 family)
MDRNSERGRGAGILRNIGRLPGALPVASLAFCAIDPLTPWQVKGAGIFAALYLMMPIDLIPDFLIIVLGLGVLDDVAVVYMAYNYAKAYIRPKHRQQALEFFGLDDEPPGS